MTPCGLYLLKKVLEKRAASIFMMMMMMMMIMMIWEIDIFIQCKGHAVSEVSNSTKIGQVKAKLMHAERRTDRQARRSRRFA